MNVIKTKLPGVVIIEPRIFGDERGYFFETFQAERYKEHGIKETFVQDNFSRSAKGTVRGLHYQLENAQGKLVFVTAGKVLDIILDIRLGSPTFGQWITVELSSDNHRQVYVPRGMAHGFCVVSDSADFLYKCTDFYNPKSEYGVLWNDPDLDIAWPLDNEPILSPKDMVYPCLKDVPQEKLPRFVEC